MVTLLDLLERCLEKSEADHVEMRHHRRVAFSILVKDGKVENLNSGILNGVCVRSLVDGSWGFSSTTVLERESIIKALKDATSLAGASKPKKRRSVKLAEIRSSVGKYVTPMKRDPRDEDLSQLIKLVIEADKQVREYSEAIISESLSLSVVDDDLAFINSEGTRISQRIVRCHGGAFTVAKWNGNLVSTSEGIGAQAGLEVFDETPLLEAALTAAERAVRIAPKRVVPGGFCHVVLENKIVGLLAHEAVGHCAEADLVYGGSFLADKIGHKVASEKITLVDDGRFENGFGTMMYDDEGTPTEKTVIIENGVVKSFMHSRETAYQFDMHPTGNARAWSFEYDPIIRMRNTYISPGDQTVEELIEGVKEGYFLKGGGGGQADFNGEFMFGTQEAVRIEDGELKESFRGATISGNAFEVLSRVDGVGKDFVMRRGLCGKEQVNYVGMGGPSVRTFLLVGGR